MIWGSIITVVAGSNTRIRERAVSKYSKEVWLFILDNFLLIARYLILTKIEVS